MLKINHSDQLVLARRGAFALAPFALGQHQTIMLTAAHREAITALLEQFTRLDAKEQKQIAAGIKGKEFGKLGGAPKTKKSREVTSRLLP
jgi:hypothetical protein